FLFSETSCPVFSTLSLHDALPIYFRALRLAGTELPLRFVVDAGEQLFYAGEPESGRVHIGGQHFHAEVAFRLAVAEIGHGAAQRDRKSTRLNSSHQIISYAVFCLK